MADSSSNDRQQASKDGGERGSSSLLVVSTGDEQLVLSPLSPLEIDTTMDQSNTNQATGSDRNNLGTNQNLADVDSLDGECETDDQADEDGEMSGYATPVSASSTPRRQSRSQRRRLPQIQQQQQELVASAVVTPTNKKTKKQQQLVQNPALSPFSDNEQHYNRYVLSDEDGMLLDDEEDDDDEDGFYELDDDETGRLMDDDLVMVDPNDDDVDDEDEVSEEEGQADDEQVFRQILRQEQERLHHQLQQYEYQKRISASSESVSSSTPTSPTPAASTVGTAAAMGTATAATLGTSVIPFASRHSSISSGSSYEEHVPASPSSESGIVKGERGRKSQNSLLLGDDDEDDIDEHLGEPNDILLKDLDGQLMKAPPSASGVSSDGNNDTNSGTGSGSQRRFPAFMTPTAPKSVLKINRKYSNSAGSTGKKKASMIEVPSLLDPGNNNSTSVVSGSTTGPSSLHSLASSIPLLTRVRSGAAGAVSSTTNEKNSNNPLSDKNRKWVNSVLSAGDRAFRRQKKKSDGVDDDDDNNNEKRRDKKKELLAKSNKSEKRKLRKQRVEQKRQQKQQKKHKQEDEQQRGGRRGRVQLERRHSIGSLFSSVSKPESVGNLANFKDKKREGLYDVGNDDQDAQDKNLASSSTAAFDEGDVARDENDFDKDPQGAEGDDDELDDEDEDENDDLDDGEGAGEEHGNDDNDNNEVNKKKKKDRGLRGTNSRRRRLRSRELPPFSTAISAGGAQQKPALLRYIRKLGNREQQQQRSNTELPDGDALDEPHPAPRQRRSSTSFIKHSGASTGKVGVGSGITNAARRKYYEIMHRSRTKSMDDSMVAVVAAAVAEAEAEERVKQHRVHDDNVDEEDSSDEIGQNSDSTSGNEEDDDEDDDEEGDEDPMDEDDTSATARAPQPGDSWDLGEDEDDEDDIYDDYFVKSIQIDDDSWDYTCMPYIPNTFCIETSSLVSNNGKQSRSTIPYLDPIMTHENSWGDTDARAFIVEQGLFLRAIFRLLAERDQVGVEGSTDLLDNIWKKGSLKKKGMGGRRQQQQKNFPLPGGKWRVVYVELRQGNLSYYHDSGPDSERKTIHLRQGDTVVQEASSSSATSSSGKNAAKENFVFEIRERGSPTLYWMASSEEERQAWIRAIQAAMIGEEIPQREIDLTSHQESILIYTTLREVLRQAETKHAYLHGLRSTMNDFLMLQVPVQWVREQLKKDQFVLDMSSSHRTSRASRSARIRLKASIVDFWSNMADCTFVINGIAVPPDSPLASERVVGALTRCFLEYDRAYFSSQTNHTGGGNDDTVQSARISELQAVSYARNILLTVLRSIEQKDVECTVKHLLGNDNLTVIKRISEDNSTEDIIQMDVSFAGEELPEDFQPDTAEMSTWIWTTRRKNSSTPVPESKWKERYAVLSGTVLSYYEAATPRPHGLRGQLVLTSAENIREEVDEVNVTEEANSSTQQPEQENDDNNAEVGKGRYVLCFPDDSNERLLSFASKSEMVAWKDAIMTAIAANGETSTAGESGSVTSSNTTTTDPNWKPPLVAGTNPNSKTAPAKKLVKGANRVFKGAADNGFRGGMRAIRGAKDNGIKAIRIAKDGGIKAIRGAVGRLRQNASNKSDRRRSSAYHPSMQMLLRTASDSGRREPTVQCVVERSRTYAVYAKGMDEDMDENCNNNHSTTTCDNAKGRWMLVQAKLFQAFLMTGGSGGRIAHGDVLIDLDFGGVDSMPALEENEDLVPSDEGKLDPQDTQ